MRRFVAVPVPASVRRALEAAVEPLHGQHGDALRFARPEGWHITLAFLGEVPDERVDEVTEVVRATVGRGAGDEGRAAARRWTGGSGPVRLRLAPAGRFGRGLLWAGVADDPPGAVASLGSAIQDALVAARLPVQVQPVRAHITIARSRRRDVDDAVVRSVVVPEASWQPETVELWRSRLGDGPARYEVDASVPLPRSCDGEGDDGDGVDDGDAGR